MRLTLCALLVGGSLLAVPHASAAPNYDWRGSGCSFDVINDTTPGGQLGGQNVWNGSVTVAIRAVNHDDPDGPGPLPATPAPTTSVSVTCDLSVNGGTPTTVMTASGTGLAQNAEQIQFLAPSGSVVVMCSNMTIGGEFMQDCLSAEETPVVPDPLAEATSLLCVVFGPIGYVGCPIGKTADGPGFVPPDDQSGHGNMFNGPKKHRSQPTYPSGTITMSQSLGGPVNTYAAPGWNCTPNLNQMTSVSCTPPAPSSGFYNACDGLSVKVRSSAVGTVAGTSSCADGEPAAAQSTGPATSDSTDSANAGDSDFAWTCAANPGSSLAWSITCTVN